VLQTKYVNEFSVISVDRIDSVKRRIRYTRLLFLTSRTQETRVVLSERRMQGQWSVIFVASFS